MFCAPSSMRTHARLAASALLACLHLSDASHLSPWPPRPAAPCSAAPACGWQQAVPHATGASHASVGPCSRAARACASVPALPGCREHQAALQAAVAGGVLQLVGTDHAVFNSTQKRVGRHDFRVIPNGVNGLEASGRASLAHPLRGGLRQLRAQLLALAVRGRLARRVLLHFFALPCTRVHVRAAPAGQGPGRRQPAAAMPCAVCRLPSQRCVHPAAAGAHARGVAGASGGWEGNPLRLCAPHVHRRRPHIQHLPTEGGGEGGGAGTNQRSPGEHCTNRPSIRQRFMLAAGLPGRARQGEKGGLACRVDRALCRPSTQAQRPRPAAPACPPPPPTHPPTLLGRWPRAATPT